MQPNDVPVTMAPAYGGMFRPQPPRTGLVIAIVIVILVVVVGGGIGGFVVWKKHDTQRRERRAALGENGVHCTHDSCAWGVCIREAGDHYCGMDCEQYGDCPSGYVCHETRSGRHHACMKVR